MSGDPDIASVASLIGEPARAAVLVALADGRALAASTLAIEAGVAPSTLSLHLARLVDGGLISVEHSGRYRYFRLASSEVAHVLESLAVLAPPKRIRSLSQAAHYDAIKKCRTCYDHLAGKVGVAICDGLVSQGFVVTEDVAPKVEDPILGPGRSMRYLLTEHGIEWFRDLGVKLEQRGKRPLIRYCLDWSEQSPHLGGYLGAALLTRFVDLGWIIVGERRVVRITEIGCEVLAREFRLDAESLH